MYNEFFGFREKPFNITPDPRLFYANPVYEEAYASLLYGIRERKGFITLIGEVGTGKTTLLRRLMTNLEEPNHFVYLCYSTPSFEEFLSFICADLGLAVDGKGYLGKIQALNELLLKVLQKGGTGVLLVDEAQNLGDLVLENLRLLSNLETSSEKLIQIVLVGQPELQRKLAQQKLRQLKQRVAIQCRLDRLREREIGPFILARLRAVDYEDQDLFPSETIQRIALYSKGTPRLVNIICDNALLIAYSISQKVVSPQIVEEVARDLQLGTEVHNIQSAKEEGSRRTVSWRSSSVEPNAQGVEEGSIPEDASTERIEIGKADISSPPFQNGTVFSQSRENLLRLGGGVVIAFLLLSALGVKAEGLLSTLRATVSSWMLLATRLPIEQGKSEPVKDTLEERLIGGLKVPAQIQPRGIQSSPGLSDALAEQTAPHIPKSEMESYRNGDSIPGEISSVDDDLSASRAEKQQREEKGQASVLPRLSASASLSLPSNEWKKAQPIIAQSGTTVSEIVLRNYKNYNTLAIDMVKEFNPHIKDLDRIQSGEKIWLPPLTREILLRKQSDGSYQLILATFRSLPEAEKFAQGVRQKGYLVVILPQRVSGNFLLQRVVVERLADLDAVDRAWELVDTRNSLSGDSVSANSNSPSGPVAIR